MMLGKHDEKDEPTGPIIHQLGSLGQPDLNENNMLEVTYTWAGVIEFMNDQYKLMNERETEWLIEKQQYQHKTNYLNSQIMAHENINKDLVKRIKMLEYALRQERVKYAKLTSGHLKNVNEGANALLEKKENFEPKLGSSALPTHTKIAKRRAKGHRPLLVKFLEEVGLEDIFGEEESTKMGEADLREELMKKHEDKEEERKLEKEKKEDYERIKKLLDKEEEKGRSSPEEESKVGKKAGNLKLKMEKDKIEKADNQKKNSSEEVKGEFKKQPTRILAEVEDSQMVQGKKVWTSKYFLKSHMDSVRSILFTSNPSILASASEDCMIKLWDMKKILEYSEQEHIEPYFSLRGHTGPLFTMCSSLETNADGNTFLYSGGSEGSIRVWNLPSPADAEPYASTDGNNHCVGLWKGHTQPIWSLAHHPFKQQVLSVGGDSIINLWEALPVEQSLHNMANDIWDKNILTEFQYKSKHGNDYFDIPTCAEFIYTNVNHVLAAYIIPQHVIYDIGTGEVSQVIELKFDENKSLIEQQTNCLVSHPTMDMGISGHENNTIQFYDLSTGKEVKSLVGHTDSVSCLAIDKTGFNLISGSYDGSLRCWDIRKYQCIDEIQAHRPKYDESVHTVAIHPSSHYVASGGADAKIRIFDIADY